MASTRTHVQATAEHRRRARDRLLPAGDGRLSGERARAAEDFDVGAEVARLTAGRTDIGAIVTFTGIVRGENERQADRGA